MRDNVYILFWGGIIFLSIGLWIWKKDRNQIRLMDNKMTEKENNLYELYQALEEIMDEMTHIYQEKYIDIQGNSIEEKNLLKADEKSREKLPINKYHKVIELRDQGHTEEDIARELGIGKGEIRLILGFNR